MSGAGSDAAHRVNFLEGLDRRFSAEPALRREVPLVSWLPKDDMIICGRCYEGTQGEFDA
jgi:hypothetical protein